MRSIGESFRRTGPRDVDDEVGARGCRDPLNSLPYVLKRVRALRVAAGSLQMSNDGGIVHLILGGTQWALTLNGYIKFSGSPMIGTSSDGEERGRKFWIGIEYNQWNHFGPSSNGFSREIGVPEDFLYYLMR